MEDEWAQFFLPSAINRKGGDSGSTCLVGPAAGSSPAAGAALPVLLCRAFDCFT